METQKSNNTKALAGNIQTVRNLLIKMKTQIAMALPKHLDVDRVIRVALTSVNQNPLLLECTQKSLIGAIVQSAQLGLEVDGILGQASLVPFWNSKKGCREVQLIPGYKGLISLARRSGLVEAIYAQVVYEKEKFELVYGMDRKLIHVPLPPKERGAEKKGVYAVACLKDGTKHWEFLWADEAEEVKQFALKSNKRPGMSPWNTHEDDMWRKTAIRRLSKYLPLSPEFQKAAFIDEQADAGIMHDLDVGSIETELDTDPPDPPHAPTDSPEDSPENSSENFSTSLEPESEPNSTASTATVSPKFTSSTQETSKSSNQGNGSFPSTLEEVFQNAALSLPAMEIRDSMKMSWGQLRADSVKLQEFLSKLQQRTEVAA
jgi:recombination protein RecT